MMLIVILFLAGFAPEFAAAAMAPECSPEAKALEARWAAAEPAAPSWTDLARASLAYKRESQSVRRLRGDKLRHCYIGCRIAISVNEDTAVYLGWLKEQWDLTDCDASTRFEPADERATALGAELAVRHQGLDCARECATALKDR